MFHLIKRAVTSFRPRTISDSEMELVRATLLPGEFLLWQEMSHADRAHSLDVLSRFVNLEPAASVEEQRAALLHDIGKTASGLSWALRVVATIVGPRGGRFRRYHDHEEIGARMLSGVSTARTIELVSGCDDAVARSLQKADNI